MDKFMDSKGPNPPYKAPSPHLETITKRSKVKRKTNNTPVNLYQGENTAVIESTGSEPEDLVQNSPALSLTS